MRKMLFNEKYGLESAVIGGWKTSTMRNVPKGILPSDVEKCLDGFSALCWLLSPYEYKQEVAIAQAYKNIWFEMCANPCYNIQQRDAFFDTYSKTEGWSNKLYVSADNMLHFIQMDGIRMMYLQDITDEMCLTEGIRLDSNTGKYYYPFTMTNRKGEDVTRLACFDTPREAFISLIDDVCGYGYWLSNSLVFRYTFHFIR